MNKIFGLKELPKDNRDFSLGAIDKLPPLEELPLDIQLPFNVKHQGSTDWCTAFTSCAVSEPQEDVVLCPGYSFAASKEISGNIDAWGQDLRSAMKAHIKYGALEEADDMIYGSDQAKRNFEFWYGNQINAMPHRKKSFFKITGPYDHYDNIRAALVKYRTPVAIGIQFGYPLEQKVISEISNGFGHAMTAIGYEERGLIVGNSYGPEAGENGRHFITRNVINHWVGKYGAYTFIDIPKEEAAKLKESLCDRIGLWFRNLSF